MVDGDIGAPVYNAGETNAMEMVLILLLLVTEVVLLHMVIMLGEVLLMVML